ncbi:GntR family transcriptional regulator [Salipaludibacillus neizhouensis]|uniref:GntR family transcriptional regulator n=1 Tax=Salipaludibacillus neizhouensis TaxID=885475 RepID=A0A3A9K2Q3_9BACI|nr:GntR family transcriptional regulator [Salipaludibacillus neizhouensis]RKL66629.1 GntR family transcriptional regulator [Salipaludibacillus neizhouensis]
MFKLDTRSRVAIYEQLMEQLKTMIIRDVLQKDEKLPSVRNLAQELTINPNTIQKAYRELEHEGFIYTIPGKGSFVSPLDKSPNKKKLASLKQDIEQRIKEFLFLGGTKQELIDWLIQGSEREEGERE